MGNSSNLKDLRKQLRNVVAEMLPQVLTEELVKAMQKAMLDDVARRVGTIERNVKDTMTEMNNRSKDTQSYLVRSVTTTAADPGTKK